MGTLLMLRARLTGAFVLLLAFCHGASAYDLTVAKDGTGNYATGHRISIARLLAHLFA